MPKRRRPAVFTATKAVKANARERLGTPPPATVIPDPKEKRATHPRHKETLAHLLVKAERGED